MAVMVMRDYFHTEMDDVLSDIEEDYDSKLERWSLESFLAPRIALGPQNCYGVAANLWYLEHE